MYYCLELCSVVVRSWKSSWPAMAVGMEAVPRDFYRLDRTGTAQRHQIPTLLCLFHFLLARPAAGGGEFK